MEILQVVMAGIVGTVLSVALKKENPQFSILLSLVTGILIFLFAARYLEKVFSILVHLTKTAGLSDGYLNIVIKIIGISYIAKFGSEIAKDAGEGSISTKIDLAGKIFIAVSAMPVIMALMEMVQNFI